MYCIKIADRRICPTRELRALYEKALGATCILEVFDALGRFESAHVIFSVEAATAKRSVLKHGFLFERCTEESCPLRWHETGTTVATESPGA